MDEKQKDAVVQLGSATPNPPGIAKMANEIAKLRVIIPKGNYNPYNTMRHRRLAQR
jgi:hypothetical protein